ncbi:plasma membrane ascorbate-dependent reductase CYBRD1-like [Atheta coriaria]|uniref:plasma membrane ascorbate-dependent reductase CYBRD1-like n=1 Tax=Dalotia coriaria TaxID=877792 RepID=UPI0031F436BD
MDSNSVSPMPETMAPMAEFDKTPPTPPEDTVPMDDLPPPPTAVSIAEEKAAEAAHREYEEENEWGCGSWLEYTFVVIIASVLLLGSLALTLFWVIYYQDGFAWRDDIKKQFNLHPVLMVAGFITFSGFSILLYRICRCGRRIYVKLLHTVFHALAIPCVAIGFLAVLDTHNLKRPEPIPNFYSLHSWIGLVTMGLLPFQQFVQPPPDEAIVINAIKHEPLSGLGIIVIYILLQDSFRYRTQMTIRDSKPTPPPSFDDHITHHKHTSEISDIIKTQKNFFNGK